jgi:hypothetical protein
MVALFAFPDPVELGWHVKNGRRETKKRKNRRKSNEEIMDKKERATRNKFYKMLRIQVPLQLWLL